MSSARTGMDPNRMVYETEYSHEHLRIDRPPDSLARAMIDVRLGYLDFGAGGAVADLGCGTGSYLLPVAERCVAAFGIDFSANLLATCAGRLRESGLRNVRLVLADVRALPLEDACVDFAFSYTTLYTVPNVEHAIREASRIVRPGGRLVLEMGNFWSLNTIVARSVRTGVHIYHIPVGKMLHVLTHAGLRVDEHRVFQLLPMYGGPWYLRPLVTKSWRPLMGLRVRRRSLDEWVSSLPLLRRLAFRHIFVCTRLEAGTKNRAASRRSPQSP